MQLREKEDEFSVGSPMGFDHLSEGIFVQSGMVQTLVVRPKVIMSIYLQHVGTLNIPVHCQIFLTDTSI